MEKYKKKTLHCEELSIIVPVYNTELILLTECLDSLCEINNIYSHVYLIDDGSLSNMSTSYKRLCIERYNGYVTYVYKDNGGVSSARNYGIKVSAGYYVMFVDSDDRINYQEFNKLKIDRSYDVINCSVRTIKNGTIIDTPEFDAYEGRIDREQWLEAFLNKRTMHAPYGKLIKREFIVNNEIYFDDKMINGEDAIFNLCLMKKRASIFYQNLYIYIYNYVHGTTDNRWKKKTTEMLTDITFLFNQKRKLIEDEEHDKTKAYSYYKKLINTYISELFIGRIVINGIADKTLCKNFWLLVNNNTRNDTDKIIFVSKIKRFLLKANNNFIFSILKLIRTFR